jgi:ribosomal protein S18 acetylase RimI-like enzyme
VAEAPADAAMTPTGLGLRCAVEEDRPFLEALHRSVRWGELAPTGWADEAKLAFLAGQFDLQHRQYADAFAGADFSIIEQHGHPVGRFYVERTPAQLHIIEISLLPEWRGRGIGAALIGQLQDEVRAGCASRVILSVDRMNLGARRLYERLGFIEAPSTSHYPGASIEMTWSASASR